MESTSFELVRQERVPVRPKRQLPKKPKFVSEEKRGHALAAAERNQEQKNKTDEKRAGEEMQRRFQAYSIDTENTVNEAAMLSGEIIRFQRNGLAGEDSIKIYRQRLQELSANLQGMESNAASGIFNKLDIHDQKRLNRLLERNRAALAKIKEAQKESEFLQNNFNAPFSAQRKAEKVEQQSVWTQKPESEPRPGLAKRTWGWIKNPKKWFS